MNRSQPFWILTSVYRVQIHRKSKIPFMWHQKRNNERKTNRTEKKKTQHQTHTHTPHTTKRWRWENETNQNMCVYMERHRDRHMRDTGYAIHSSNHFYVGHSAENWKKALKVTIRFLNGIYCRIEFIKVRNHIVFRLTTMQKSFFWDNTVTNILTNFDKTLDTMIIYLDNWYRYSRKEKKKI